MKGLLSLLSLFSFLLLLSSCASDHPGLLEPFAADPLRPPEQTELIQKCAAVYPRGKRQFVHAIEFRTADGRSSSVLGVTVVDGNSLSCALMTVEGFILFQARLSDRFEVDRAVPPFDGPGFAQGLMEDVRALFLRPEVSGIRYGRLADGAESCRMTGQDGTVTDILPSSGGCWKMKTYDAGGRLTRTILARSCRKVNATLLPRELGLTVPGPAGYTLKMTLISADGPTVDMSQMIR